MKKKHSHHEHPNIFPFAVLILALAGLSLVVNGVAESRSTTPVVTLEIRGVILKELNQ